MQGKTYRQLSLYLVGFVSSLTGFASVFVLLALATSFLGVSPDGEAASSLQALFYLGVATTGLFGGWVLQRLSQVRIGVVGPVVLAVLAWGMSALESVPIGLGFGIAFVMYVLSGLDHPNNLRFYREVVDEDEVPWFFSKVQAFSTLLSFASPVMAGWLIGSVGYRMTLLVAGGIYAMSIVP